MCLFNCKLFFPINLFKLTSTYTLAFLILIFSLSSCSLLPESDQIATKIYIIKPGDTLFKISTRFNLSLKNLIQHNPNVDPRRLQVGSRLFIPQNAHSATKNSLPKIKGNPSTWQNQPWSGRLQWPIKNIDISSSFGRRGLFFSNHDGIDLRAPKGTSIFASGSGKVTFSRWQGRGYGNLIIIQHDESYSTAYAHNLKNMVKKGQYVVQGQIIGKVGNTGNATGYHVHFEIRKNGETVDPQDYLPIK